MIRSLIAAPLLMFCATGLAASGNLSWTDPNTDTLCDHQKLLVCSQVTIKQIEAALVPGAKTYLLDVTMMLYPRESQADSVSMAIVVETSDHVKHSYHRDRIPIKIYESSKPGTNSIRYCDVTFGMPLDVGATAVLAIDAEESVSGDVLARHAFR